MSSKVGFATRSAALLHALDQCEVTGVTTNVAFLERVVAHHAFASGRLDTGLIDTHRDALLAPASAAPDRAWIAAALSEYQAIEGAARASSAGAADPYSPWHAADAWWNGTATHRIAITLADASGQRTVTVKPNDDGSVNRVDSGSIAFDASRNYVLGIKIVNTLGSTITQQNFNEVGSYAGSATTGVTLKPNDLSGGTSTANFPTVSVTVSGNTLSFSQEGKILAFARR